jgi:hypothetical protein
MFYSEKMKMVKSTTNKKLEFSQAQELFATVSTKYIKEWTDKQLKNYLNEPVVIPVGSYGFLVGTYKIQGKHSTCWRVEQQDGRHLHDFVSKSNAILYCLKAMKNYATAAELLELDRQLGKLDRDIVFYEHTIKNAKNEFKVETAFNRCADARMQRRSVYNILKKTLISAKYIKFGNTPL